MTLKILTFNWHAPYLVLLSKIGHDFLVLEPETAPGHFKRWEKEMRPLPPNIRLVSQQQVLDELNLGNIDLALTHNIKDLIFLHEYTLPKIHIFHNCLTTEIGLSETSIDRADYLKKIYPLLEGVEKVFISKLKRNDWGLDGEIILPGMDVSDYGGYTGESNSILRVGNYFKERDLMLGFTQSEKVIEGFPCTTLGLNPTLPDSMFSKGFEDLLRHYRKCRVYLNTTVEPYEDGYNLAMLEAMATGMPVISTANRTSPIVDGVNGFISENIDYLRQQTKELLKNPSLAREIGERARQTVQEKFSMQAYLHSWHRVIRDSIVKFLDRTGVAMDSTKKPFHEKTRKNILMDFVSYPATTAFYLERALRKTHNVITCGGRMPDELIRKWDLENLKRKPSSQDYQRGNSDTLAKILGQLPTGWKPDLYFWVETGLDGAPSDLADHRIPKACYLIDTHLHFDKHKEIARHFDFVFIAQKAYVEPMKTSGCKNVTWLPLACDPDIHGKVETKKIHEVGFAGTVTPNHVRRNNLLRAIGSKFNLILDRKFHEEMAELYSQSLIVFNNSINNDLNMRVFEALCSGSLLLTDRAVGSGLEEIFENGKHLVIYDDNTLMQTLQYYLEHSDERSRIAKDGRREVLAKHTYQLRVKFMMDTLDRQIQNTSLFSQNGGKPVSYYQNIRVDILPLIPEDASSILEVGCGAGMTGGELKKKPGIYFAGIEVNPMAAEQARRTLDHVVEGDVEKIQLPFSRGSFDCILFADVLEHLIDPLATLKKVIRVLKPEGTVVASIPNVQFFGLINHLVEGNWTYQKEGILDQTHLRFFTIREIEKLFAAAGLEIIEISETLDPSYEQFKKTNGDTLSIGRISIRGLSPEEIRRFFVFQYKILARLKVGVSTLSSFEMEGAEEKPNKEQMFAQAKALEDANKIKPALNLFMDIHLKFPDFPEAIVGEGNCYLRLQDLQSAERLYRKAVDNYPDFSGGWLGLGLLEIQRDNLEAAIMGFEKTLEINPEDDKALCGLGMVYGRKGMSLEAMIFFARALENNIDSRPAMKHLLEISYQRNEFAECEKAIKRYLEVHPANLNMLFGLAGVQYKMDQIEEARESLETILTLDPNYQNAIQMLQIIDSAGVSQ